MHKVFVAIASGGHICVETVTSLIAALDTLRDKGVSTGVSIQVGGYKAYNCNTLVKSAQEGNFTHIMFIDTDMTFPSSGIIRLLDHDKDIVGGNYNARGNPISGNPRVSVVKLMDEKGELINAPASSIPDTLFKAGGLGLGFLLVKTTVFDKLERPYFNDDESPEGEHRTEDIVFCLKARQAGFDIWCNPTIPIGHIGSITY